MTLAVALHGPAEEQARFADAFGPVALTTYAQSPSGAHLFRVQHERLLQLMERIVAKTEGEVTGEGAVDARNALTTLSAQLPVHQGLEDAMVMRLLGAETKVRMLAEQFEREMAPLLTELAALARRYPTPSSILQAPRGEFSQTASSLFTRLRERFRREERDLFPSYDRGSRGSVALAAATA